MIETIIIIGIGIALLGAEWIVAMALCSVVCFVLIVRWGWLGALASLLIIVGVGEALTSFDRSHSHHSRSGSMTGPGNH